MAKFKVFYKTIATTMIEVGDEYLPLLNDPYATMEDGSDMGVNILMKAAEILGLSDPEYITGVCSEDGELLVEW